MEDYAWEKRKRFSYRESENNRLLRTRPCKGGWATIFKVTLYALKSSPFFMGKKTI